MSTVLDPQDPDPTPLTHTVPSNGSATPIENSASMKDALKPNVKSNTGRPLVIGAAILSVCAALLFVPALLGSFGQDTSQFVFHNVKRGSLLIQVTERGNLESQQNVKVFCEVDDIAGDNLDGTAILEIVPNGSEVKKGDLLVRLDSSGHLERLDKQTLDTETAIAKQIQAKISYESQVAQSETLEKEAELAVELAKLQLDMFVHPENGTNVLEADEIERSLDDTENEILAAKANLKLIENERRGTEELFKLGYAGKSDVDKVRLDYLQAQSALAAKVNRLETQLATLGKKTDFERRMSEMQYKGDVTTAKRTLDQVRLNNVAEIAKAKVGLEAADRQLDKEQERLARYKDQLEKCLIYAEQDGMVAYATRSRYSRSSTVAEGAMLRERQHILSLPNLRRMQVKTSVHESVQNQIEPGQPVTVRIDAFPDRVYTGSVKSIGVLPEQGSWHNSDSKMYETYVTIDEDVNELKPGMTAMVEIHIDQVDDVLTVPVQAVQQKGKETYLFTERDGRVVRQDIEVGRTNDKFVEIKSGLNEGDRVVLNPLAVIDS